jgi:hypothetical protein
MHTNIMSKKGFVRSSRSWRQGFLAVARQAESSARGPSANPLHSPLTAKTTLQPRFSPIRRMALEARGADA